MLKSGAFMLLLAMGTNQYVEATGKIIKKKLATGGKYSRELHFIMSNHIPK